MSPYRCIVLFVMFVPGNPTSQLGLLAFLVTAFYIFCFVLMEIHFGFVSVVVMFRFVDAGRSCCSHNDTQTGIDKHADLRYFTLCIKSLYHKCRQCGQISTFFKHDDRLTQKTRHNVTLHFKYNCILVKSNFTLFTYIPFLANCE